MKKVLFLILDGFGIRKSGRFNAVKNAQTPNFDTLWKNNPHRQLNASGHYVGLPEGYTGNSEVGHIHFGAGRIIPQELKKINQSIKSGDFFNNKAFLDAMRTAKNKGKALHLMGLLSDGGVHSHINHLFALLKLASQEGLTDVFVHCFLDGRDKPPKSALKYVSMLEKKIASLKVGKIASVAGRFYAMDRDNRWNREHKAYAAMVEGQGLRAKDALEAIKNAYARGETDEFVRPTITDVGAKNLVTKGDSVIFFNFRSDRARELTRAFVEGRFNNFKRKTTLGLNFVSLVQYDKKIKTAVAFPPSVPKDSLGEVVSKAGLKQFRISETEKYAHVTYFFNCGREKPFNNEERTIIPSPKVRTYDTKPQMSARKVTKELIERLKLNKYELIVVNYANPDMVGHTGNYLATKKAISFVDECLGKVVREATKQGYSIIISADHGNAEEMFGEHRTSHTTNKVPLVIIDKDIKKLKRGSCTADIAPTILKILDINIPHLMREAMF